MIGTIDDMQKLHVRNVPLGEVSTLYETRVRIGLTWGLGLKLD